MFDSVNELTESTLGRTFIYILSPAELNCAGMLSAIELCYSIHQKNIVHAPADGYLIFHMLVIDKNGQYYTVRESVDVRSKPERQKCTTSKNPRYCCDIVDVDVKDVTLPNENVVIGINTPSNSPVGRLQIYNATYGLTYSLLPLLGKGIRYKFNTGKEMEELPTIRFYLSKHSN